MNAKINVYVFFSVLELISLVSESFSSGMIFMAGSLRTSLLAIFLSNDNSNDGNNDGGKINNDLDDYNSKSPTSRIIQFEDDKNNSARSCSKKKNKEVINKEQ